MLLGITAGRSQSKAPARLTTPGAAKRQTEERELTWTFGSKQQRGWYLYEPLIQRLINTKHDGASSEFARAVSRWQGKAGLEVNWRA